MAEKYDFEDIRPFYDHEANAALTRMSQDPLFVKLINYFWPGMTSDQVKEKVNSVQNVHDFQEHFMDDAIRTIVKRSSAGLTNSGFENLDPNSRYLFIANHRDILLDSAILQILLFEHGHDTSEITFGDNLMEQGFITDFGRLNRMFTVKREGTARELYDISKKLSAYIRHTILDKKVSVWIAQRNGRTKDGFDQTQTGLLKMINISGNGNFVDSFKEVKIVPLTISYEYEPCDALKVQELYLSSLHTKYVKAPGEDLNSIITGIVQPKGRIHMTVGNPIIEELEEINKSENENEKIKQLANLIDKRVYSDFKLWPLNYVAYDLLTNGNKYEKQYSSAEKDHFIQYVEKNIEKLKGERDALYNLFIKMYAAPVINKESITE